MEHFGPKKIRYLFLHRSDDLALIPKSTIPDFIDECKRLGIRFGVSAYDYRDIEYIVQKYNISVFQIPANLSTLGQLQECNQLRMVCPELKLVGRSILFRGLLDEKSRKVLGALGERLSFTEEIFAERGLALLPAIFNFFYTTELLDDVVIGVNDASQLGEIHRWAAAAHVDEFVSNHFFHHYTPLPQIDLRNL